MAIGETTRSSPASSSPTINNASMRMVVNLEDKKSMEHKESEIMNGTTQAVPVDALADAGVAHGEHPDGGLRAWMVVIGVSGYMYPRTSFRVLTSCAVCCRSMCDVWPCQRMGCESCRPTSHLHEAYKQYRSFKRTTRRPFLPELLLQQCEPM